VETNTACVPTLNYPPTYRRSGGAYRLAGGAYGLPQHVSQHSTLHHITGGQEVLIDWQEVLIDYHGMCPNTQISTTFQTVRRCL
jgi:hypothetical protein